MTKLTFTDAHNYMEPIEFAYDCNGKPYKAIYILTDSNDGVVDEFDYGVFVIGRGDNTLNNGVPFVFKDVVFPAGKSKVFTVAYSTSVSNKDIVHKVNKNGETLHGKRKMLRFPDRLQWVIHKEKDGSTWLYKPQVLEKDGCITTYSRGIKAYDVTGMSYNAIVEGCCTKGTNLFSGQEVHQKQISEVKTRVIGERIPLAGVYFSKEYADHYITEVLQKYPKMSVAEVTNIVVNEGGSVDAMGVIRAPNSTSTFVHIPKSGTDNWAPEKTKKWIGHHINWLCSRMSNKTITDVMEILHIAGLGVDSTTGKIVRR